MSLNNKMLTINKSDFQILFKNCKRKNVIFGITLDGLISRSYWLVRKELPELITGSQFEEALEALCLDLGYRVKADQIRVEEALPVLLYILDQLTLISELEQNYLVSPPDNDLLNAGIKDLDELGALNVIDSLAGGDLLKWEGIKALPYNIVFDKLRKNTLEAAIQKRYAKIIKDKSKSKTS